MPFRVAGNVIGQQWVLPFPGDAQAPALHFGSQNGISRGSANIINVHVGGSTPLTTTGQGVITTTMTATQFAGDGSGLTNIIRTVAISTVEIVDFNNVVKDDTALDSQEIGYVRITGIGFGGGSVVTIGNVLATSTTAVSSSQLFAAVSPQAAGTYAVTVTRADGVYATQPLAVTFSPFPVWSTSNTLTNVVKTVAFTQTLSATEPSGNITYAVADGSALPPGVTLSSSGVLDGNITSDAGNTTIYSFSIQAIDVEYQNIPRTFGLTALSPAIVASGGTVTYADGYAIHTFSSNASFTVTANPASRPIDYLIVGGGGGGGGGESTNGNGGGGGGGGAGGVVTGSITVSITTYTIVVGGGGGGGASNGTGGAKGANGSDSSAFGLIAIGGGGGASEGATAAGSGGSGGGAGGDGPARGTGTAGQGYDGGLAANRAGGGGGGAGSVGGTAASTGGAGGSGVTSAITGAIYAGGGGGGGRIGIPAGSGGSGGGGAGAGGNGTANTGGGGGGQSAGSAAAGGTGGSGAVVLRYFLPV